jgi:hypothetical protein
LIQLYLGELFNHPLAKNVFPDGLAQITFSGDFDQPSVEGVLPSSLTQLTFDYVLNQPIPMGVLPGGLTQLTFGFFFNQPIPTGVLPGSLTQLALSRNVKNNSSVFYLTCASYMFKYISQIKISHIMKRKHIGCSTKVVVGMCRH